MIALALGLALSVPAAAQAQDYGSVNPPGDLSAGATLDALSSDPSSSDANPDDLSGPQGDQPDGVAAQLAEWVTASDDNGALSFLIVDKLGARIFAFDDTGGFLGSAPILLGLARGDDATPGIGGLKLSQISADERTTPAGRFVAALGPSEGHGKMLWVDLPDAISLHPVMSVNAGEHRLQRIASSDPDRHRISYGCINVPAKFYHGVVEKALDDGKIVVYVLPDTKSVGEVFPGFARATGVDEEPDRSFGHTPYARMSRADRLPDMAAYTTYGLSVPRPSDP